MLPLSDGIVAPGQALNYLQVGVESSVALGMDWTRYFTEWLNPKFKDIPNQYICPAGYYSWHKQPINYITDALLAKAVANYKGSWYGRNVCPEAVSLATNFLHYNRWWTYWSSAMLAEHLIREGVEVTCRP